MIGGSFRRRHRIHRARKGARVRHADRGEQFRRCDLEQVAVTRGVEGFQDEGNTCGILGDSGAVGVAVVPVAGQDPGGVRVDDLAGPGFSTVSGSPSGVKDSLPSAWRMTTSPVTWSRSKAPARGRVRLSGLPEADSVQAAALLARGGDVETLAACGEVVGDGSAVLDRFVVVVFELGPYFCDL
ncbi:hypothetical protein [Nonomuraea sp. 10N515B]|uniref:hypothetical protein n=1 Tax=Nonomuraea sp. 10N515B TaxID=3457422 RepID=UPI003FCC4847